MHINYKKSEIKNNNLINASVESKLTMVFPDNEFLRYYLNTLRRFIINYVKTQAYDTINIKKNTTNVNNNIIKNIIEQLPIYNVNENNDIVAELNIRNDTDNIIYASTHDLNLYIDSTKSDKYLKYDPILIFPMIPNSELHFEAKAKLGYGLQNIKWSAAKCYFNDNILYITSTGNYNEFTILKKAINTIINQLQQEFEFKKQDEIYILKNSDNYDISLLNLIAIMLIKKYNILASASYDNYLSEYVIFKTQSINKIKDIKKELIAYYNNIIYGLDRSRN